MTPFTSSYTPKKLAAACSNRMSIIASGVRVIDETPWLRHSARAWSMPEVSTSEAVEVMTVMDEQMSCVTSMVTSPPEPAPHAPRDASKRNLRKVATVATSRRCLNHDRLRELPTVCSERVADVRGRTPAVHVRARPVHADRRLGRHQVLRR